MHNSREKGQKDIENLVNDIILSDEDYIGSDEETVRNKIDALLGTLNDIFNDNNFRPHYFFIFDLLDKKPWNSLTAPIAFIKVIEELLHSGTISCNENEDYSGIKKYLNDSDFRYNVDMFISALKYELMVRKSISKAEYDITNCQIDVSKITDDPMQAIKEHSIQYNSTLEAYKKEFDDSLLLSQEAQKDAEEKYAKAEEKYVSAKATFDDTLKQLNTTKGLFDNATKDLNSTTEEIEKMRSEMNSVTTNMLTILGIFVSIIFVIIGAYFTVTGEVFNISISQIIQVNLGRFILMGHILLNLLFVFMFMISRLSSKSISVICRGCNDSICVNPKCGFLKRLVKKYPYVIYSNIILIGSYIVLFGWWVIEYFAHQYILDFLNKFVLSHPIWFMLGVVVIVIILIFAPILRCLSLSKDKQEKKP